jgi:hypothetical protein
MACSLLANLDPSQHRCDAGLSSELDHGVNRHWVYILLFSKQKHLTEERVNVNNGEALAVRDCSVP